jgi:hypothetical protein
MAKKTTPKKSAPKKTPAKRNIPKMSADGCPTCGKPMKGDKSGKLVVCHTGHSFLKHRKKA